ncbi:MAG: glycosyltransferase family 2 protein [Candidatus Hydrogenedentes bacterium]|nr:glycosyltransferase family 2 protein [Candidatus Hydrogenedentota bacterium]
MPKISIIIATFSRVDLLRENAAALLAQTWPDFELIYVDDGSSDGSAAVLDALAQAHPDRLRVVHQENRGPGPARNAGVAAAMGEYILIADDDIIAPPDLVSRAMARYQEAGCDVLVYAIEMLPDAPAPARYMHHRNLLVTGTRPRWGYIGPAFFLMPKALYIESGGFSKKRMLAGEDFEYCQRMLEQGKRIYFDPRIRAPHHFPTDWEGCRRRVATAGREGFLLYVRQGRSPEGVVLRAGLKLIASPLWCLWHFPVSLYPRALWLEWVFFANRWKAYRGQASK